MLAIIQYYQNDLKFNWYLVLISYVTLIPENIEKLIL